ncbi:MAG TPA: energy transducer TonB [Vicinamibacteria bacterium]|nr:energy transducer TonB [Vicinamibacteria bacterium]
MNDPVNTQIEQRQALDRGLSAGFLLSLAGHLLMAGMAFGAAAFGPKEPLIKVAPGFVVPLPRGGGGTPNVEPAGPAPAAPEPAKAEPPAPRPEPPPKVVKPPKETPRRGLPPPDARKRRATPAPTPPPRGGAPERGSGASAGAVRDATGRATGTPGIELGPPGPGVPGGAEGGDYYLAGVQRKIWLIWTRQIKSGFTHPVTVSFTILANGSVEDVRVVQSSGASLLDLAAQRSVFSAAPFNPLPKDYGTNRYTIQAIFRPTTP